VSLALNAQRAWKDATAARIVTTKRTETVHRTEASSPFAASMARTAGVSVQATSEPRCEAASGGPKTARSRGLGVHGGVVETTLRGWPRTARGCIASRPTPLRRDHGNRVGSA